MKQEPGAGRRRWWCGDGLELIAWFDDGDRFTGFQLCSRGCAFTWRNNGYWTHVRVNEENGDNPWQAAPVLESNGAPTRPPFSLIKQFEIAADSVGDVIRNSVANVLREVVR